MCGRLGHNQDSEAEALPAAETAEAEQGPRSVFCKGAATPEAKAGHRNPGPVGGLHYNPEPAGGLHRNPEPVLKKYSVCRRAFGCGGFAVPRLVTGVLLWYHKKQTARGDHLCGK